MIASNLLDPAQLRDVAFNAIKQNDLHAFERAFFNWESAVSSSEGERPEAVLEDLLEYAADLQCRDIAKHLKDKGAELCDWKIVMAFLEDELFDEEKWALFLELGWDVNYDALPDKSLLISMVEKGGDEDSTTRARWLLAHGADPNQPFMPIGHRMEGIVARQTKLGTSLMRMPLDFASCGGSTQMIDILLEYGASLSRANPLHAICCWHNWSWDNDAEFQRMGEKLLELGADINAFEFAGEPIYRERVASAADYRYLGTPLHYAAQTGYAKQVEFLLRHGADRHKVIETHGFTALDLAFLRSLEGYPDGEKQAVLDLLTDGNKALQVQRRLYEGPANERKELFLDEDD